MVESESWGIPGDCGSRKLRGNRVSGLLLLYDTKDKDLARDLRDFLFEVGADVAMIPLEVNLGRTLQDKEAISFEKTDGALFLLTPGADRDGLRFPSPSVTDEMGRAKERFRDRPERLLYLVDRDCHVQSVDQKAYIHFTRADMRSVVEAMTLLIRELKAANLMPTQANARIESPDGAAKTVREDTPARPLNDEEIEVLRTIIAREHDEEVDRVYPRDIANSFDLHPERIRHLMETLEEKGMLHSRENTLYGTGWYLSRRGRAFLVENGLV